MSYIKTVVKLVTIIGVIITLSFSQNKSVPGRIIVEFQSGVIALPEGSYTSAPSSSIVLSSTIRTACSKIQAYEIEKLFRSAVPGQTQMISPITGRIVEIKDLSQYFIIKYPTNVRVDSVLSIFSGLQDVNKVSKDYIAILDSTPNDPLFSSQWHLKNNVNSKFDINAVPVLSLDRCNDIKIAIIDGGVRVDHPDLHDHIWFGDGSELQYDTTTSDGRHGTYVAGVAAAIINNSVGVAGVAGNCKIMPRHALHFYISELMGDIDSAALFGAYVINCSWHYNYDPDDPSTFYALRDVIRNAFNMGSVITASMGNTYPNTEKNYPAAFDSFVVAVGALAKVNNGDTVYVRGDQTRGSYIDVTAPGESIWTTSPIYNSINGYYTPVGMTSFSTPQVAGLAALMFAVNPSITNSEIMNIIKETATLFSGWETQPEAYGHGLINCYKAVKAAYSPPQNLTATGVKVNNIYHPKLSWNSQSSCSVDKYAIYRKIPGQEDFVRLDSVAKPETTYIDMSANWAPPDTGENPYKYYVTAILGDIESDSSNNIGVNCDICYEWPGKIVFKAEKPTVYSLSQNYPNPFNPITEFKYGLPEGVHVTFKIYDVLGREVTTLIDGFQDAGYKVVSFDASNISSGVYFYKLQAGNFMQVHRMLLLK